MKKLIALVFLSSFLSVQIAPVFAALESNSIEKLEKRGDKKKKKDKSEEESKEVKKDEKMSCCKDMENNQKSCCKKPEPVKDEEKK